MAATHTKKRRILSPKASKRRSEITKRVRPWEKSTGPRTAAGKARSRLNALKHGERAADCRATDRFLTTMDRMTQCYNALGYAELGLRSKATYFLGGVTVGDFFKLLEKIKVERPPNDCPDTDAWSRYLARFAEARSNDMPASIAEVPLLAVCAELRAECNTPPASLV